MSPKKVPITLNVMGNSKFCDPFLASWRPPGHSEYAHVDCVESGGPVLAESVPPVVGVHPEVVQRPAEDLQRQTVQVEGVPVASL